MKFKINDKNWEIIETSQEEIIKIMKNRNDNPSEIGKYYGVTYFDTQTIFLDENLCKERKRSTLMHELSHCYIGTFIFHSDHNYCEEDVCDIVSNSHDIINGIVNKYFS